LTWQTIRDFIEYTCQGNDREGLAEETEGPCLARHDSNRISLRIRPEDRALLLRAAAHSQTDLATFVLYNAVKAARRMIAEAEQFALSERDSLRVLDVLENPPPPNTKLMAAAYDQSQRL
jgi:uncharacterized protein (DUF1778 family)